MPSEQDAAFLAGIREYVSRNPEVAAYVTEYASAGVKLALKEAQERAADFEIVSAVAIASRYKQRDELILSKLQKWNGKSALCWDATIKELKK